METEGQTKTYLYDIMAQARRSGINQDITAIHLHDTFIDLGGQSQTLRTATLSNASLCYAMPFQAQPCKKGYQPSVQPSSQASKEPAVKACPNK